MPSDKERALSLVVDLLNEARVKRSAAELAHGECDVLAEKRLKREAALFESASNLLDPEHLSTAWSTNP